MFRQGGSLEVGRLRRDEMRLGRGMADEEQAVRQHERRMQRG